MLIFKSMGKTRKPFKFLHNRNYQNSLLLKLNMFDALMHSIFIILFIEIVAINWTLFGFILLSYLILFSYVSSIGCNESKDNKERHHFQDIVLIWQVSNKKEDYSKRFMHGIFDKWNVLVYLYSLVKSYFTFLIIQTEKYL